MNALSAETVLVRPKWARLKHCDVRDAWLLLVPERVLFPCATTTDILQRLETPMSLAALSTDLAAEYDAPTDVIMKDVADLLGDLVEKGYVRRVDA